MSGGRLPWVIAGTAVVVLGAAFLVSRSGHGSAHPDPRPGVTAERVLPPALVPHTAGALEAYAAARSAPGVLDGVYCHCNCSRTLGHRSLLTCFESEHGAYCDICMGEAMTAVQMAQAGSSLLPIREAIDRQFGS